MRAVAFYIVSYIIFPFYGVAADPGLAVGLVAGLTVSAPFVLVGVVIFGIGFPVGIAVVQHYRSHHTPNRPRPEPRIHVNTPSADASSDAANHSGPIPIPGANVPDNTHLLPPGEAAASLSTPVPSDPFSKSIHSDVSSITSMDAESVLSPDRMGTDGSKTTGDQIPSNSKVLMDHILRGTDCTCEQAKGPIPSQIVLPRPSINRFQSDEITFLDMVTQMVSIYAGDARGSPRSSTKSSESSESSESNKSESSNAEESPEGSGILRPIASIKSFSEDEITRNRAVRIKQDNELNRGIVEPAILFSAEPDTIKPEIEPEIKQEFTEIFKQVAQLGLDGGSTQVAA